jgi:ParB-like chromosome segregation protein Spo0J
MDSKSINHPAVPAPTFHPLITIFPEMEKGAFEELVLDIKIHGVREPISIYTNQIVDGRNRWLACQRLNITCPMRAYEGKESDLLGFVLSKNLYRRQLSESQRAMVAARVANMQHGGDRRSDQAAALPLVCQAKAGEKVGVCERLVRDGVKVLGKGEPEVVRAVEHGKVAVSAAAKIAEHPPEVQRQAVVEINDGKKPAAVVRALPALPASSGKATPTAPAPAKLSKKEEKEQENARTKARNVCFAMARLEDNWFEDYDEDLWSFHPSQFWPLLDSADQEDLVRLAKVLGPWLADIIAESKANPKRELALAKVQ